MLEIKSLKIETSEGKQVIQEASFEVAPGTITIISGVNGSGKSSLLSGMLGHPKYKVPSGQIILDGVDITNYKTEAKAKLGMYLAQQFVPAIEGVTLIQLLYKAVTNSQSLSKLGDISILELNKSLESYCEEFALDKAFLTRELNVGLSGGEKKQAMLLSLLALVPKYIFLDEADSGMDSEAVEKLFKVIKYLQAKHNSAFVIVTHSKVFASELGSDQELIIQNQCLIKK